LSLADAGLHARAIPRFAVSGECSALRAASVPGLQAGTVGGGRGPAY